MRSFLLSFMLLWAALGAFAQSKISVQNSEYAGKTLVFQRWSDPISNEKEVAFSLKFDAQGKASATLNNKKASYAFCEFGVYKGMVVVEPQKNMTLKLPPFREKSFANQKNPYFKPVEFWFISEEKNQLSDNISAFEQELNKLVNKSFNKLYFSQSKAVYDSIVSVIDSRFANTKSAAFAAHKNMQLLVIKADAFRLSTQAYSAEFNKVPADFWLHGAFVSTFNKALNSQLSFSAKAIKGKEIMQNVAAKNLSGLLQFVKTKYKLSGTMAELALLKLLHDGFYSKDFNQSDIRKLVANAHFKNSSEPLIRKAAKNMLEKFGFLAPKSVAPVLCGNNLSGTRACSDTNKTLFKYVVFADVETQVCQEQLKYLKRVNELFNKHMEIIVVLRDTDKKRMQTFLDQHKIPATQIIDSGNKLATTYKIRSYPQCFLLNEKHEVVFADTKAPLDGFEQQFGSWLRKELFMRQRNQAR